MSMAVYTPQPNAYHDGRVTVHGGDCLEVLAKLPADSFDSVVTDPPYHFASIIKRFAKTGGADRQESRVGAFARHASGFMGKQWDGGQIAHEPETWAAVLRVMKPGAHLVAFHAPKNWHRLAVAIEDAGFEIRDTLLWLFGSGFAKSRAPWRLEIKDKVEAALRAQGVEGEIAWKS